MYRQKGVTLSGLLLWSIVIIVGLLLGFRIGPAYYEYYKITRQLRALAEDPASQGATRRELEYAFVRRATMEDIQALKPGDLRFDKEGGRLVISGEYSVRVPLVGNLSACMDFAPSSRR